MIGVGGKNSTNERLHLGRLFLFSVGSNGLNLYDKAVESANCDNVVYLSLCCT